MLQDESDKRIIEILPYLNKRSIVIHKYLVTVSGKAQGYPQGLPRTQERRLFADVIISIVIIEKKNRFSLYGLIIHQISDTISPSYQSVFQLSLELLVFYRSPLYI